jgi:hypothetical protein
LKRFGKNADIILLDINRFQLIENEIFDQRDLTIKKFISTQKDLINAYKYASTKGLQIQLLSLIPKSFEYKTIMGVMPVSEYQIKKARNHALIKGKGSIFTKEPIHRSRIEPEVLEFFLQFIIGEDFLQDVAYGTRVLKTEIGNEVIPNVVRLTSNSRIVSFYMKECKDENMKALSERSCHRILEKCGASFRKSLKGLDSMKVDGINGFEKLESIVEELESYGLDQDINKDLKSRINLGLNYLKFGYRKNLEISSECSDHCVTFALSENTKSQQSKELSKICQHEHKRNCIECVSLAKLFDEISDKIICLINDESLRKILIYYLVKSKKDIFEWKHHIIRGKNQGIIKYKQYEQIKDFNSDIQAFIPLVSTGKINNNSSIVLCKDFAMKFEKLKYLEKQSEWYGKRGICWHISVLAFNVNGKLKTISLMHTLDNAVQDSNLVLGIADSIMAFISRSFVNPTLDNRSDNAASYHCGDVICLLPLFAEKHSVKIASYHFSEPQLGKDICDRKISVLKRSILQYVNDGKDVVNSMDMKDAVLSNNELKDVVVFCCEVDKSLDFKKTISFPGISKYHSFEYDGENIKCFRYYGIGTGIEKRLKDLISVDYESLKLRVKKAQLVVKFDSSACAPTDLKLSERKKEDLFKCDDCKMTFMTKRDLENHESKHEKLDVSQIGRIQSN